MFSHYSSFIPLVLVLFVWRTFVTLCVTVTNIFMWFQNIFICIFGPKRAQITYQYLFGRNIVISKKKVWNLLFFCSINCYHYYFMKFRIHYLLFYNVRNCLHYKSSFKLEIYLCIPLMLNMNSFSYYFT